MGTMGESTRRRMESVAIAGGFSGTAGRQGPSLASVIGGYNGGMGGTWGKAARNLDVGARPDYSQRPASAGRLQRQPDSPAQQGRAQQDWPPQARPQQDWAPPPSPGGAKPGVRERVRSASSAAKSVWHDTPTKELPRAPARGTSTGRVRPGKGTVAKTTMPLGGLSPVDYTLQGSGLGSGGMRPGDGAGGGGFSSATFAEGPYQAPVVKDYGARAQLPPAPRVAFSDPPVASTSGPPHGAMGGEPGDGALTEGYLAGLEDSIRDAVRQHRNVYETSKDMLLKLFRAVDDGSGDVSVEEFCQVCSRIGVAVNPAEARALFRRFGCDNVMPYQKFAHTLITQPNRQLAEDMPARKGAFHVGQPTNFQGKITYPQCRKPVFTPSDWDPSLVEISSELPNARLALEFAYGYQGKDCSSQNLFATAQGSALYFIAGVAVVYTRAPVHAQSFFLSHTDDIMSMAICPATISSGGKEYPPYTLAATGQVSSHEAGPMIFVWDTRAPSPGEPLTELAKIQLDKGSRGLCAMAFSPDGKLLVTVAMDNYHSVDIYDWRKGKSVGSGRGFSGEPIQVNGVEWNPFELTHHLPPQFLTFGRKHIKSWLCDNGNWISKTLSTGKLPLQNVHSAVYLSPRGSGAAAECLVVAGCGDGQLYVFKGGVAIKSIQGHRPGPSAIQVDGKVAYNGVRGMKLHKDGKVLVTGGADGVLCHWDVADGSISEGRYTLPPITLRHPNIGGDKSPQVRAVDFDATTNTILVGTHLCDIMEVTPDMQRMLVYGHAGELWAVATHPVVPNRVASACDSGTVMIWDLDARDMIRGTQVTWVARAIGWSATPMAEGGAHHLAVGGSKGDIRIFQENDLRPVHQCKDCKEGILDLKYSPNSRFLAASSADTFVDIYNASKGYTRVARCSGHSANVLGVDWSTDSSIIQSYSADMELLYWNAKTGKQVPISQKDTPWASWTSLVGFPVMGIWPNDSDISDINSVDRSKSGRLLVTGDDSAMVKLFNCPCVVEDAPHRAYRGHSSHVMVVRFNANDTRVVTGGGRDQGMFQFRVVEVAPEPVPEPLPAPVWGPMDDSGRTFGYTQPRPGAGSPMPTGSMPQGSAPQSHPSTPGPSGRGPPSAPMPQGAMPLSPPGTPGLGGRVSGTGMGDPHYEAGARAPMPYEATPQGPPGTPAMGGRPSSSGRGDPHYEAGVRAPMPYGAPPVGPPGTSGHGGRSPSMNLGEPPYEAAARAPASNWAEPSSGLSGGLEPPHPQHQRSVPPAADPRRAPDIRQQEYDEHEDLGLDIADEDLEDEF